MNMWRKCLQIKGVQMSTDRREKKKKEKGLCLFAKFKMLIADVVYSLKYELTWILLSAT